MKKLVIFALLIFSMALVFIGYAWFYPDAYESRPPRDKVSSDPEALPIPPLPDTAMASSPQLKEF